MSTGINILAGKILYRARMNCTLLIFPLRRSQNADFKLRRLTSACINQAVMRTNNSHCRADAHMSFQCIVIMIDIIHHVSLSPTGLNAPHDPTLYYSMALGCSLHAVASCTAGRELKTQRKLPLRMQMSCYSYKSCMNRVIIYT